MTVLTVDDLAISSPLQELKAEFEAGRFAGAVLVARGDTVEQGDLLAAGNYHGFNTYNIENGKAPKLIASSRLLDCAMASTLAMPSAVSSLR